VIVGILLVGSPVGKNRQIVLRSKESVDRDGWIGHRGSLSGGSPQTVRGHFGRDDRGSIGRQDGELSESLRPGRPELQVEIVLGADGDSDKAKSIGRSACATYEQRDGEAGTRSGSCARELIVDW
jgi:hypothetical protein